MQAFALCVGAFVTIWLGSLGMSTVELLIYTKIEAWFLTIPLHILGLHESRKGMN